jgi:Esterase PHB depolymerase
MAAEERTGMEIAKRISGLFLLLCSLALTAKASETDAPLRIDPARITVSGISSGAQMAHQLHIAYSDVFSGVGLIAGGPFGCAEGSLSTALARCMSTFSEPLPVERYAEEIRAASKAAKVAAVSNLENDSVWLFHGSLDHVVAEGVSTAIEELYGHFMSANRIRYVKEIPAAHLFPGNGTGATCEESAPPFIGDCGYDAVGELLQHLYAGLIKPSGVQRTAGSGHTAPTMNALEGASTVGLDETAWMFIPPVCSQGTNRCALHLVLHGCGQSASQIGSVFMEQTGYLPWAEANNIVLAFPQVVASPANPLACWDWWGYTGTDYRWREGAQMEVLVNWVRALSGAPLESWITVASRMAGRAAAVPVTPPPLSRQSTPVRCVDTPTGACPPR